MTGPARCCSTCNPTEGTASPVETGIAGEDERQVVEGTQVLAQAIVAAANGFPDKSVRSAHAVFARAVTVGPPVEFDIDVLHEGRSMATAIVAAQQNGRRCITVTVLADVPTDDVIRTTSRARTSPPPPTRTPRDADDRAGTAARRRG